MDSERIVPIGTRGEVHQWQIDCNRLMRIGEKMHSEQLRFFKLLYQIRNASAAARLIPMSPQGLMKSIRSLETELGVPLFIIDKNGTMTLLHADDQNIVNTLDAPGNVLPQTGVAYAEGNIFSTSIAPKTFAVYRFTK